MRRVWVFFFFFNMITAVTYSKGTFEKASHFCFIWKTLPYTHLSSLPNKFS